MLKKRNDKDENEKEMFYIPNNIFPFRYNKINNNKVDINNNILNKNQKNISYIRNFMKHHSPIREKLILKGTELSTKIENDIKNITKQSEILNLDLYINKNKEKKCENPIKLIHKHNYAKSELPSFSYMSQLKDYYDNLEKKYFQTGINFYNKRNDKNLFPELSTSKIKKLSEKKLSSYITFKNSIKKKYKYYNSNNTSYSNLSRDILGNNLTKNGNLTQTTYFHSFSNNQSNKSKNKMNVKSGKRNLKLSNLNFYKLNIRNFLNLKNDIYFLSEENKKIPEKLKTEIKDLLKNENKKFLPGENTKKLINNYLSTLSKEKFISNKPGYKKVYVILDGTLIFSHNFVKGIFIEIPKLELLNKMNIKERFRIYKCFLSECANLLHTRNKLEYIFLTDGTNINDLIDIPENENSLIVSFIWNFKGINYYNEEYEQEIKNLKLKKEDSTNNIKIPKKKFKIIKKKKKYLLNQSFTFGKDNIDDDEIDYYYSDKDEKRTQIKLLKETLDISKYKTYANFHNNLMTKKINKLTKIQNKKIKKFNSKQKDETKLKDLEYLIKQYNKIRGEREKIKVNFDINLPKSKKINLEREFDKVKFYGLKPKDRLKQEIFDFKANYEYRADFHVEKNYPDLISYNIPKVLEEYPKLQRRQFYEIFILFKTLLKYCVSYSKNLEKVECGIDFETFYNCSRQINSQGMKLANKIFRAFNLCGNKCLNWEEYFKGFITLNSKDLKEKIELFLKIIDTDKNGKLSFYEVYDLSVASLKRTIGSEEDNIKNGREVIKILGDFFAKLIFQLVDMPLNSEIPIEIIKQKITEGGIAASYLEMLICADNFV